MINHRQRDRVTTVVYGSILRVKENECEKNNMQSVAAQNLAEILINERHHEKRGGSFNRPVRGQIFETPQPQKHRILANRAYRYYSHRLVPESLPPRPPVQHRPGQKSHP